MAHVYAARAVLPSMIARGEGYLLHPASAAGLLAGMRKLRRRSLKSWSGRSRTAPAGGGGSRRSRSEAWATSAPSARTRSACSASA
jgi:hypothetical protein